MAHRLSAVRAMSAQQRAQRRQDLLLAAQLLRSRIDADLAQLQPGADRVLIWADAALWLRRHWHQASAGERRVAAVVAVAGGIASVTGIGRFALRHRGWLHSVFAAWHMWRQLRA
jgi:hypothetical protein